MSTPQRSSSAIALVFAAAASCVGVEVHVDPAGTDAGDGSPARPLASLAAARERVRALRRERADAVDVLLRAGTYRLAVPLELGPEDGGDERVAVTWSAAPGAAVVVSGGVPVAGWTVGEDGRWHAPLPPEAAGCEQLAAGVAMLPRAREPDAEEAPPLWRLARVDVVAGEAPGQPRSADVFLGEGALADWTATGDVDLLVFKDWATFHHRVASIDPASRRLRLEAPLRLKAAAYPADANHMTAPKRASTFAACLLGHPTFVDRPGEWAVDRRAARIVYRPRAGEAPDATTLTAPVARQLIVVRGSAERPVRNLHLRGLVLAHTGYAVPAEGHDGGQAGRTYTRMRSDDAGEIGAAVEWRHVVGGSIAGCELAALGGNGICVFAGCREVHVEGNHLHDIGANAILVGTSRDPGDGADLPRGNVVADNWIHHAGIVVPSAVGVWQGFARGSAIERNRIHDLPYSGISLGWDWSPKPTGAAENRVVANHVYRVAQLLGDGGGIYTLGRQPGSRVEGNLVHDVRQNGLNHAAPTNGLYFDEGSAGFTAGGNVVHGISHTPVRLHKPADVTVAGNVLVPDDGQAAGLRSPPYDKPLLYRQRGDHGDAAVAVWGENRVIPAGAWAAEADAVLAPLRDRVGPQGRWRERFGEPR